jgi:LysM repeat protein
MKPSVILAIAVIALGLGAFGLFAGLTAKDTATKLESRITDVAQQTQTATASSEQANDNTKKLRDAVQSKLTEVMSDMANLQQQISDITNKTIKVVKEPKEPKDGDKKVEPKKGDKKDDKKVESKKGEKMAKPADGMYPVKKGDTVKSIAKKFGVKEHAIYEANPTLEANKPLESGAKIRIP